MRCAAVVVLLALGLGGLGAQGCGGDGGRTTTAAGDPGAGQLEITYVPEPARAPRTGTLVCPATGVDQQHACDQIESLTSAFDPVPGEQACTDIYGGPEQISLMGTWAGERVRTTLVRTNGCEIKRYEALAPVLLPLVGGSVGG